VVLLSRQADDPRSRAALNALCQTYWFPLYAFLRRQGLNPEGAQDVTQSFFAHLLEHHALATVDQAKGKFRSFLLASLRNFLANEWKHDRAQKRGGGCSLVSLDADCAEARYAAQVAGAETADRAYDRHWALALMEKVLDRLRSEQVVLGKCAQFERLRACLMGEPDAPRYAALAAGLEMSEESVRMAVSRLRRRFRELLREEIAHTVAAPADIDEEIRDLFAALRP
jgi:RNA polymerase sigma-70 factor (ECF subfamily)